jgi:acyl-CoA thioesterase FadM
MAANICGATTYFEDILDVETKIHEISKVKIIFNQSIFREKNLLIDSKILITPVNDKGKIVKMPIEMLDKLQLSKI